MWREASGLACCATLILGIGLRQSSRIERDDCVIAWIINLVNCIAQTYVLVKSGADWLPRGPDDDHR
jgi:hypothetical protein